MGTRKMPGHRGDNHAHGGDRRSRNQATDADRPIGDPDRRAGDAEGAAEAAVSRPIAELEAEVVDLKDRLLRALAEQENIRRRMQRELEDAVKFAASGWPGIC